MTLNFNQGDVVRYTGSFLSARDADLVCERVGCSEKFGLLRFRGVENSPVLSLKISDLHYATSSAEGTTDPISTTAFKTDDGKDRFDLLMTKEGCASAIADVVKVLSFAVRPKDQGGKGYIPHSWREVPEARRRYLSALYRHLAAIERGEELDDESGLPHLAHVATNALFLLEFHKEAK